jgi:cation-transporting P-type ATPase E
MRAGRDQEVTVSELVVDDILELRPGDQVPVDGDVIHAAALEVDESLLTGESAPVEKGEGDEALPGSFVVAGSGLVRALRVGPAAYGNALAADARRFKPVRSELRRGIDRFLLIIAIVIGGPVLRWCSASWPRTTLLSRQYGRRWPAWSPWSPRVWCC